MEDFLLSNLNILSKKFYFLFDKQYSCYYDESMKVNLNFAYWFYFTGKSLAVVPVRIKK